MVSMLPPESSELVGVLDDLCPRSRCSPPKGVVRAVRQLVVPGEAVLVCGARFGTADLAVF